MILREIIHDEDIKNMDVKHSWALKIMELPDSEHRDNAMSIIDAWIDDEMEHLFEDVGNANSIVKETWIYLLEREAIKLHKYDISSGFDPYPNMKDPYDAISFYITYVHEADEEDKKTAMIFLQLILDGYMKPDIKKVIMESDSYNLGINVDVSLRNHNYYNNETSRRINNIDRLKEINYDFKKQIEQLQDVIGEFETIGDHYRDIYEFTCSNLAFNKCYSDEEICFLSNSPRMEDDDFTNVRREISYRVSTGDDKVKEFYNAIRFCKDNNLIFPFEEKIIANGTLEEKRLLALECIVRMKLYR